MVIAKENDNLLAFYACDSIRTLTKPFNPQPMKMDDVSLSKWTKGTFSSEDAALVVPTFSLST